MKIPFTGGCSCGAIRYECTAEPIMMFKCHCRDCQHVTGSGFAPAVLLPLGALRLTRGQLRYHFTSSMARGKHKRGFCPGCATVGPNGSCDPEIRAVPAADKGIETRISRTDTNQFQG
ncbi:MAG: aldehyde-activating protein [Verrucomicrobia bacterium]|nr:MAG: aldehyde-activating protein [Verrucomicrobiota bacterium]